MYGAPQKKSVLGSLRTPDPNVSAFAKGQSMAAAAGLGLDREQKAQERGVQQMQADGDLRRQQNQNSIQRATNDSDMRMQEGALKSRKSVFDTSTNFDYAALQKRQRTQFQQALLNNHAKDF
jgi:hypothetical protein